ncbi:MAG TPA: sigma-70 family RNA polymerase sigma factor [Puia sp.]|nr:sigma-70 family RNA polymerase sigma factor [Puia sp.]
MPASDIEFFRDDDGLIRISQKTYRRIYYEYFGKFYFYATQYLGDEELAKDAVNSAFLQLWERREKLKFEHENQLKRYMYAVVKGEAVAFLRKTGTEREALKTVADLDCEVTYTEIVATVRDAITRLSPQHRRVLELFLEGYSFKEIAAELNISENTVRGYKLRAVAVLQDMLGKDALVSVAMIALGLYESAEVLYYAK